MSAIKASSRRHSARHRVGQCDSCRRSFNNAPLAPMLQDAVWCKLAAESEILCAECCFKRAYERDIDLTRADLRLCVLNLAGWPFCYFNLFRDGKRQSSERAQHLYERYLKTRGDNPHANKLTIHILAAVAKHEREAISARTKAALAAAKARGKKLGGPKLAAASKLGHAANRAAADRFARNECKKRKRPEGRQPVPA